MGRKTFIFIIALMSISLSGIIVTQVYWIKNAIANKKEQFNNEVQKTLNSVYNRIKSKEEEELKKEIELLIEDKEIADAAEIKNFLFQQIDTITKQKFTYGATILEENFKLPTDFLDNDTIIYKRVSGKKDFFHSRLIKGLDNRFQSIKEDRFSFSQRLTAIEKAQYSEINSDFLAKQPVHLRINNIELNAVIKDELRKNNILLDFKYIVYNKDGISTRLKSNPYEVSKKKPYKYPLFIGVNDEIEYDLHITFPTKNQHILSGISNILLLSLFFIFIMIVVYSNSLYQLIKQKKISQIKTDFINNMTHEFKTPIATINLALDSIKNPKIINDNNKVLKYIETIKEENKRMHTQVENVLMISELEKNQLKISKKTIDMHRIIDDAITRVSLLTKDKNGILYTHFDAKTSEIQGNQFHLTNIVVNMLENAIKYSINTPKIDVYTESTDKFFIIKIKDKGIGMSKSVQKLIFDKFYRAQKGNIHDVKGHGLGLSYVKEIVEKHRGAIFVESEKEKGSIFTVKLPIN